MLRSGDDGSAAGAATLAVSAESEEVRPQLVDARTGRPLRAMRVESVETEATKAVGTTATDAVGAKAADAFEPLIEALNRIEGTDISSSDVLRLMPIEGRAQTYDRAGASHFLDYLSAASKAGVVSSDAAAGILSLAAPHRTSLPLSNSLAYARSNPHTFNPKTAFCPLLDLLDLTHAATLHERPNIRASSLSPHLSPSILSLAGVTTAEDYFLAAEGAGMIALYRDRVFQHKADPRVDLRHRRPQTIPYGTPLASLDAFDPLWDALQASRPITAAGSWAGVEVCMKMRAERALTYEYAGVRTFEGYLRMAEALGLVVRTWEDRVRRLGRFRLRLGRRWEAFDLYDRL